MPDQTDTPHFPGGTNIRMLLQDCSCDPVLFQDAERVCRLIQTCLRQAGLSFITSTHHHFDEGGYTLAVILSESHLVVHTWSEHSRLVLIELSICDFSRDNQDRARCLAQSLSTLYQPQKNWTEETGMIPRIAKPLATGHGFYVDMDELVTSRRSARQQITVAKTASFGTALLLDGVFQTTEADHAFYHEPLVHVPMMLHPHPRRVLICGGGDGGAAYQVLKHPGVQRCDIVEIDAQVVELARAHLSEVHHGAFEDARVHIRIADAAEYLQNRPHDEPGYDVILIDSTHPVEENTSMFSQAFYRTAGTQLYPNGMIGLHAGLPYTHPDTLKITVRNLQAVFANAMPYLAFVPSFATVSCFFLGFSNPSGLPSLQEIAQRIQERGLTQTQVFSAEMMHAWFAVPPNIAGLMDSPNSFDG